VTAVFVDTSGWIALLSRDDQLHGRAVRRYEDLTRRRSLLVTNNYVVDEAATRLRYGLGLQAALSCHAMLLAAVKAARLRVAWVDERAEAEAWRILEQYADVKLSLTDAACAVTARAARISEVFGCDSDFAALGFTVLPGQRQPAAPRRAESFRRTHSLTAGSRYDHIVASPTCCTTGSAMPRTTRSRLPPCGRDRVEPHASRIAGGHQRLLTVTGPASESRHERLPGPAAGDSGTPDRPALRASGDGRHGPCGRT